MAVSRSSRFRLHRWDSGSDPVNRAQSDLDNLQIETLAAVFREGNDADKGVASDASNARSFYSAIDTGILYYSNGSNWLPLNDYAEAGDISSITIGSSASAGTSSEVARADHIHPVVAPSTPTSISTAAAATGVSTSPARADHVHNLAAGAVVESALAANSVTETKVANGAITENKIGTGAVTETKIGANAVSETKIANDAVTPLKIASTLPGNGLTRNGTTGVVSVAAVAGGGLAVSVSGVSITTSGVLEAMINTAAVTETKIGTGAVTETKIGTGAVTPLKIGSTIVGSGASAGGLQRNVSTGVLSVLADSTTVTINGSGQLSVASGGITDTQLAANAVSETKIGTGQVTPLKISSTIVGSGASAGGLQRNAATGVLSALVDNSSVVVNGSGQIAVSSVSNSNLTDGSISPAKLTTAVAGNGLSRNGTTGALSVAAAAGGGLAVSGSGVSVASSGVLEAMINTAAVTETKIGAGAVTETKIGAGAITETKIGADAVTPLKIASTIVGSGASAGGLQRNISTGVLSALTDNTSVAINGSGQLSIPNNAINGDRIAAGVVVGAKVGAGVYRNVNSLATGGRIEFTTVANLPTVGSALSGVYTNGDIIFGY